MVGLPVCDEAILTSGLASSHGPLGPAYGEDLVRVSYSNPTGAGIHPVWADPVDGASPLVWNRAVGWYFVSLIEVLDVYPNSK
jgi:hypothetical protein